jgi:8-oxo-dGTP pyrophosphatase MutT (NUDIX family)
MPKSKQRRRTCRSCGKPTAGPCRRCPPIQSSAVPTGYRMYLIDPQGPDATALRSPYGNHPYRPGYQTAWCAKGYGHRAPALNCECGIIVAPDVRDLLNYWVGREDSVAELRERGLPVEHLSRYPGALVLARVATPGILAPASPIDPAGHIRAEACEPMRLWVPGGIRSVAAKISQRYKVPVTVEDEDDPTEFLWLLAGRYGAEPDAVGCWNCEWPGTPYPICQPCIVRHRADRGMWAACPDTDKVRHWGRYGAAGVLLADDQNRVLLTLRSATVEHPRTWSIPGGALESDETPREAAFREAREEVGLTPDGIAVVEEVTAPCRWFRAWSAAPDPKGGRTCGWTYTTLVVRTASEVSPHIASAESDALRWVPADQVPRLSLHPAFAETWPTLRAILESKIEVAHP